MLRREAMRRTRCYFCGGPATDRQPLVPSADHPDYLEHKPATPCPKAPTCRHPECSPDWDCPPCPDGMAACAQCYKASPVDDLTLVERKVYEDGRVVWVTGEDHPERAQLICLDGCREWKRVLATRHTTARPVDRDDSTRQDEDRARWEQAQGQGRAELRDLWRMGDSSTRECIARGVEAGALRVEEVATRSGGVPRKVYWWVEE